MCSSRTFLNQALTIELSVVTNAVINILTIKLNTCPIYTHICILFIFPIPCTITVFIPLILTYSKNDMYTWCCCITTQNFYYSPQNTKLIYISCLNTHIFFLYFFMLKCKKKRTITFKKVKMCKRARRQEKKGERSVTFSRNQFPSNHINPSNRVWTEWISAWGP